MLTEKILEIQKRPWDNLDPTSPSLKVTASLCGPKQKALADEALLHC